MAKRGGRGSERQDYWRRLVAEWSASGMSQEAFCRCRGVSVATFRWWKWWLGKVDGGGPPQKAVQEEAPTRFAPVRVLDSRSGATSWPSSSAAPMAFELELPRGWRVRMSEHFDARALERLLEVVEARGGC